MGVTRRAFLSGAGVAAVSGSARAQQTPSRPAFSRTLNAVTDLGLDNTGGESISDTVERALTDGTLIEFPDGRYALDDTIDVDDATNVGIVAAADARPTLTPSDTVDTFLGGEHLVTINGENILFGGFVLDITTDDDYGGRIQCIGKRGTVRVFNMTTYGQQPGGIKSYRIETRDDRGVAVVENVNIRDGARGGTSATGVFVGPQHAGSIYIRNCDIWHQPSKGIYASNPAYPGLGAGGTVHVEGGVYKNNNDCDVRLGTSGSTIRNIVSIKRDTLQGETVTWDDPIPLRDWNGERDIVNTRSIRLKHGRNVLIEGCEFIHETGQGDGGITAEGSHDGDTTIRNCRFRVTDADIYPIWLRSGDGGCDIETVSITGDSGRGAAIQVNPGRDGTTVRDSCIRMDTADGIVFSDTSGGRVTNTNITVGGSRIVTRDAAVSTSGIGTADSCPLPDETAPSGSFGAGPRAGVAQAVYMTAMISLGFAVAAVGIACAAGYAAYRSVA